ncbi:hypothetical protein RRG08_004335 [Elysia crispata]|uniref:Uncharacterized protein n=1 Tax=Elysia crispata TaxID=231223 RepID=A0AAE1AZL3_9GAST|nr:hypothetical protein RRG08_004335 [Elysia crispata]
MSTSAPGPSLSCNLYTPSQTLQSELLKKMDRKTWSTRFIAAFYPLRLPVGSFYCNLSLELLAWDKRPVFRSPSHVRCRHEGHPRKSTVERERNRADLQLDRRRETPREFLPWNKETQMRG